MCLQSGHPNGSALRLVLALLQLPSLRPKGTKRRETKQGEVEVGPASVSMPVTLRPCSLGSVLLLTDPFSSNRTDQWRGSDVSPNRIEHAARSADSLTSVLFNTEVGLQRSAFQTFALNVEMFIIIKTELDLKTILPPLQIGASAAVINSFQQPVGQLA